MGAILRLHASSLASLTPAQWRAFLATYVGWMVDSFDFTVLGFVLIDIQRSFTVNNTLAGALGTVTLVMRFAGGTIGGGLADRIGRKPPLILSILWFSLFACLCGFSTSYPMLFSLRALFGLGMGAEWAAGVPLVIEHWPARLSGIVSGLLMSGWYLGYLLAAAAFQFLYPLFSLDSNLGWRAMFWVAIVPAICTIWIRARVTESPLWLEKRRTSLRGPASPPASDRGAPADGSSLIEMAKTALLIGSIMCVLYSVSFWYPTLLRQMGRRPFPYLVVFNAGAVAGTIFGGQLLQIIGHRRAMTVGVLLSIAAVPLYVYGDPRLSLWAGAALMGAFTAALGGMLPAYLASRFPLSTRAVGSGVSYHGGALIGSTMPMIIGGLRDHGISLPAAMGFGIAVAGCIALSMIHISRDVRHFERETAQVA